jgi:wobble nucleotide-excising tRNase
MNSLRSIRSIDGFPGFADIEWTGPQAARFNLVYGWNRSGKTTVGRLLRMLESDTEIPNGFEDVTFSLNTDSGIIRESDRLRIRVLNEDFIDDNVSFSDASAKPIIMVGDASVDLDKEISDLTDELTQLRSEAETLAEERKKIPDLPAIRKEGSDNVLEALEDSGLTRYRGRTYNRTTVRELISSGRITSENLMEHVIDDRAERDALLDLIGGRHRAVSVISPDLSDLETSFSTANSLLTSSIEVAVIQRLQDDEKLRAWIGTGYQIHTERNLSHCEFCGKTIPQERLARYGAFFTDEATKAEKELRDCIADMDAKLESLDPDLPDSSQLIADLRERYTTQQNRTSKALETIRESCNRLLASLKKRKGQMHVRDTRDDEVPVPKEEITVARQGLSEIAHICADHTSRVAKVEEERPKAAKRLEEHIIADTLNDTDYFRHQENEQRLRTEEEELNRTIDAKERALADKRSALRKTGIALEKINELIEEFLGPEEIQLVGADNDDEEELPGYHVLNRGEETPYLSEGEKSVVALSYFLVKLDEEGMDPNETIIVLDDPVDSQDGNFLFRTVGLLRSMLDKAGQVIVLTHNFQFFDLVRDWLTSGEDEESEMYLIEMRSDGGVRKAVISPLPDLLRNYKTEYQYLVGRLLAFKENKEDPQAPSAPDIPNIARKVLEYFSSFKWSCPKSEPFTNVVQNRFIRDGDKRERGVGRTVVKFLHVYSHGEDFSQPVSRSAMEAESICSNVLDLIRIADKNHYKYLEKAYQKSSG